MFKVRASDASGCGFCGNSSKFKLAPSVADAGIIHSVAKITKVVSLIIGYGLIGSANQEASLFTEDMKLT